MTLPFEPRPGDPAADHLNTLLDAMRSGTRAPDAASTEAADLARTADELRGLVRRAESPAAAYLADHPLQNRWEDIMTTATAFPTAPPAATGETFAPSAPVSNRTRRASAPPIPNRLNAWLSAAIVALLLLGTVGGAWWLGPGGSGPADDGRIRLAAVTQGETSPESAQHLAVTPESSAEWLVLTDPTSCQRAPLTHETYAEIMTTVPDLSGRLPTVSGPASPDLAAQGSQTVREYVGCEDEGQIRAYESPTRLFYESATIDNRDTIETYYQQRASGRDALQEAYAGYGPDSFRVVLPGTPPQTVDTARNFPPDMLTPYLETAFNPQHVIELEDGRLAVPATWVSWELDPYFTQENRPAPSDSAVVYVYILTEIDGSWFIDDRIDICLGACVDQGTPIASPLAATEAPAPLMDLLAAVPAEMPGQEEGPNVGWTYADVEQQLASMGFTPEEAVADPLQVIGSEDFASIAWASGIFHYSTDEEFVAAIGFNPFMARQVLGIGLTQDPLTVLRGDWDEDALVTAWETAGYTQHTTESGITAWTIGPNGEIDPAHPIQSQLFQLLNNVVILDGGILVYAGTMETLELAIAAHGGEAQSARDDENIAPILATVPEDTVSLVAFDQPGSAMFDLERQIEINPNIRPEDAEEMIEQIRAPLVESREAVGPMPNYHGVLFGITGGSGENGGEVILRLGAASEEDAAQIATVIEWRWDNFLSQRYQRPLDTVMTVTDATHEGTTAMITFDPLGNPMIWRDLLQGNDLMPFAVDREDQEP